MTDIPNTRCAKMFVSLADLLLAGAAHADHPVSTVAAHKNRIAVLAQIARAGDLTVAGINESNREPTGVADVDAAGCSVAFKTASSNTSCQAQIADFSRDLMIVMVSAGEVQISDNRDPSHGFTLRSRRAGMTLHDELADIQQGCRAANVIF